MASVWPETAEDREDFKGWQYEVAAGDTTLGFREWQEAQAEEREQDGAPGTLTVTTDGTGDTFTRV